MEKDMSLYILPDEILLIIFNYCDTFDLIRLYGVCKQFYNIISILLNKRSNHLLVTGQMSEKFRERCQPLLSSYTSKFYTNYMWKYGNYEKKIINSQSNWIDRSKVFYHSNILMTNDTIVLHYEIKRSGHFLCADDRTKNGSLSDNWIIQNCNPPIMVTVLCNDVIVSSHIDNSIREWTIKSLRGRKYFKQKLLLRSLSAYNSREDFTCKMDATSRNIITSSFKGIIKIWKYTPQEDTIIKENMTLNEFYGTYVSALAFDFTGTKFAASYRSQNDLLSCIIYDISNCCTEKYENIGGTNALKSCTRLNLLWEDHNTILCTGRNEIIKKDIRTHKVVCTWSLIDYPEYTQEYFTCMSSDNLYAIMTGMSNGQVILWDQRQSIFTQRYNICNRPIWSLEFDSSHMFAVGKKIYELDFTQKKLYTRTRSGLSY